jgi:hypothetical protein
MRSEAIVHERTSPLRGSRGQFVIKMALFRGGGEQDDAQGSPQLRRPRVAPVFECVHRQQGRHARVRLQSSCSVPLSGGGDSPFGG